MTLSDNGGNLLSLMATKRLKEDVRRPSVRLTPEDEKLAKKLEAKTGLNFTGIVRLGLRRLAEAEGMTT